MKSLELITHTHVENVEIGENSINQLCQLLVTLENNWSAENRSSFKRHTWEPLRRKQKSYEKKN